MSRIRQGETERAKYWRLVLLDRRRSGLSQAAFCRRRGVKSVTFAWWKRPLAGCQVKANK